MADKSSIRTSVEFLINDSAGVEWHWRKEVPDLTPEQAQVIGQVKGMSAIAESISDLAEAVRELAAATRGER